MGDFLDEFPHGKLYLTTVEFSGHITKIRKPPCFYRSVESWLHSLTNRGPECRELAFVGELLHHAVAKMVEVVNRRFPEIDMYPRVHSGLPEHVGEWIWRMWPTSVAHCNTRMTLTFPLTVFANVDREQLRLAIAAEMRASGDDRSLTGLLFSDFIRQFDTSAKYPYLNRFDAEIESSCWSFMEDEVVVLEDYN